MSVWTEDAHTIQTAVSGEKTFNYDRVGGKSVEVSHHTIQIYTTVPKGEPQSAVVDSLDAIDMRDIYTPQFLFFWGKKIIVKEVDQQTDDDRDYV